MKLFLSIIITILFISCSLPISSPEKNFSSNGVSFKIPKGWEITEKEDNAPSDFYISIEKKRVFNSGVITFTWVEDSVNLEDWLQLYKTELDKNFVIAGMAHPVFDEYKHLTFNNIKAVSCEYSEDSEDLPLTGKIICFHGKNRSYGIIFQGMDKDKETNRKGYYAFEKSFSCPLK